MSMWNPDEHLPECGVTRYPICICDRLRACEQRVRLEDDDYAYIAAQSGINDLQNRSRMRLFMHGWNEALDAAEQALLRLEVDMTNWSSDETRAVTQFFPELTADQWTWALRGVGRSSQIIRALQSEQQTSELQGKWDVVIAAIEAMPTIQDLSGDTYLDLTVPEILAFLKAMP